ncbi:MAG: tyrosine recombinase XerC [Ilumatobacter sp.]|uniref:site-specific integrase n=1 Tax=Ilumatobacter sp. TaxID=1967498 RepID=UPI00391AD749
MPTERWVAQVMIDGRKRRTISPTEAEAKRSLRQLLKSVDEGRPVVDGNLQLGTLIDQWEAKVLPNKNLKGSTVGRHKWALNILRNDLGGAKVRTLSPERIEKALTDRAQAGFSRSSLNKIRGTLSQVLKWGVRRDLVARNVASVVELPAEARPVKEGRSLSLEQAKDFIAASAGTPLEAMWIAMVYLGLRPGEAAGLSWPDVDFERKTIHIWRAISRDENGAIILSEPKTTQSVRSLDAPGPVLDALRQHRLEQKRHQLEIGEIWSNPEALIFTSPTGHAIDPMVCRKEFTKVVTTIGLDDWTPNELRHSAASLMSDAGMPIEQVADQLGHKDLRMLQKHYRHRVRPTIGGGNVLDAALGN